jgi:hypothetical protein
MKRLVRAGVFAIIVSLLNIATAASARELVPPVNYFGESGALFDQADPVLDDKGPGYYQYPLDSRLPRGTFDLKRFTVYEEGNVVVFVIQMREYIMTVWPDSRRSGEQGFVAQTFDIYLDLDRKPNSGYTQALPGREIEFKDNMGWEKMILVTPLSQFKVYDILKDKTDDLELQNRLEAIIIPDYVQVQRDKIIVRINKDFLGKPSPLWGYQCFVMGFSEVVSTNTLLNKDVKAFASRDHFGGGWDTYGDPTIIDMIVPEGEDQYALLKEFRSEPFRSEIEYAQVPFCYPPLPKGMKAPQETAGSLAPAPRPAATEITAPPQFSANARSAAMPPVISPAPILGNPVYATTGKPVARKAPVYADSYDVMDAAPPQIFQSGRPSVARAATKSPANPKTPMISRTAIPDGFARMIPAKPGTVLISASAPGAFLPLGAQKSARPLPELTEAEPEAEEPVFVPLRKGAAGPAAGKKGKTAFTLAPTPTSTLAVNPVQTPVAKAVAKPPVKATTKAAATPARSKPVSPAPAVSEEIDGSDDSYDDVVFIDGVEQPAPKKSAHKKKKPAA